MASNSVTLKANGYNWTLSVSASVSGSTVYASCSLTSSQAAADVCKINLYIGGSLVANNQGKVGYPGYGYPTSLDASGSRSVSDGSITITAESIAGSGGWAPGGTVSTSVSVSTWGYGSLSVSSSSADIDGYISVSASPGKNNSISTPSWSCNGYSGTASTGSWHLTDFGEAMKSSTSSRVTLTSSQSHGGNLSTSFTLNVPSNYLPTISVSSLDYVDAVNGALIAGTSKLYVNYLTGVVPATNSADISSVAVKSYTTTPNVGTISFTVDAQNSMVKSGVLPMYASPTYTLSLVLEVTDSRGRKSEVTVPTQTVYTFVPPSFTVTSIERCNQQGAIMPSGEYAYIEINVSNPDGSNITLCNARVMNAIYDLTRTSGTMTQSTWSGIIGDGLLEIGSQYPIMISLRNQTMVDKGVAALTQNNTLPTMQMPISLYDDGTMVGVSIGEMATNYSDLTSSIFANFAKGLELRATNSDGETVVKPAYDVLKGESCPFPVGGIFISTSEDNPNTYSGWEGTVWQQIAQGRTLIGAGTGIDDNGTSQSFGVGEEGGEYTHQLTIDEMPSHTHTAGYHGQVQEVPYGEGDEHSVADNSGVTYPNTSAEGGDDAHNNMQPYLVVYIWERMS